ncbi:MAG: FAD-dependent oxidoreductase [Oscillospiraceae bacterium]|nr:FAD-dependent oxidoreductase [Oscillospiraceae bacterium]
MKYVTWAGREIPLAAEADLFIAGGGCAGTGAAIAAARAGLRVFAAERMFALGGTMSCGLMSKIAISASNHGIAEELIKRLDAWQKSNFIASRHEVPIDPELAKRMLDRMVIEEAGAEVRFGAVVCDAVRDSRGIEYVVIDSVNGFEAVKAKYFADCTGDGQLGFKAGASYVLGNDEGYGSSPTLMFRVANVDIEKLITEMESHPDIYAPERETYRNHMISPGQNRKNIADDKYAHFADFVKLIRRKTEEFPDFFTEWELKMILQRGIIFMNQPQKNHVLVNSTRIPYFRGNDSAELSGAMVSGRRQAEATFRFMKAFIPGFEEAFIMDTGSMLGIRESRRITGDYIFTEDDVNGLAKFDDAVVSNFGGIEIHSVDGQGTAITELGGGDYYQVPYRSIIAKDLDNLFIAGRCFSASHGALSAARNIAYCMALGQAAGSAAAQLVRGGKRNVREIDIKALQGELGSIL